MILDAGKWLFIVKYLIILNKDSHANSFARRGIMSGSLISASVGSADIRKEFYYSSNTLHGGLFWTAAGITLIALQILPVIGAITLFCVLTNISAYMREGDFFLQTYFFGSKVAHRLFWIIMDVAILQVFFQGGLVESCDWSGNLLLGALAGRVGVVVESLILNRRLKGGA